MDDMHLNPLAILVAAAIGVLIVYACLHPFTGWRDPGLPVFYFLGLPWPRYYTWVDLTVNVVGIVPFSFALAAALPERLSRNQAVVTAILLTFLLSLSVETLQNFLPSRVPSNVDVGCNTLGGVIGALAGGFWSGRLFDPRSGLTRWRKRHIVSGQVGEIGLVVAAVDGSHGGPLVLAPAGTPATGADRRGGNPALRVGTRPDAARLTPTQVSPPYPTRTASADGSWRCPPAQ